MDVSKINLPTSLIFITLIFLLCAGSSAIYNAAKLLLKKGEAYLSIPLKSTIISFSLSTLSSNTSFSLIPEVLEAASLVISDNSILAMAFLLSFYINAHNLHLFLLPQASLLC